MKQVRSVIVPLDFSKEALKGLETAVMYSKIRPVNIQLVYVHKKESFSFSEKETEMLLAKKKFNELISLYKTKIGKDSSIDYILKYGKIYEEVVNQANAYKDSIICASTHGASGFHDMFIGSNAYKIISSAECPVITIRTNKTIKSFSRIVIPISLQNDSRQILPIACNFAKEFGAKIFIAGISSTSDKGLTSKLKIYTRHSEIFVKNTGLEAESTILKGDNTSDNLIEYSTEVKANLIAMISEHVTGLELVLGNFAHQVINKAQTPVLSIKAKALTKSGSFSTSGG